MAREDNERFLAVLAELSNLRSEKLAEYGDERYREQDPVTVRWMCYSDVYRKYVRLRQQMERVDTEGLRETYRDLANYAIMAVQELDRLDDTVEIDTDTSLWQVPNTRRRR